MAAIDIGAAATDRGSLGSALYTRVSQENPANDTGPITSVEVWAQSTISTCTVATFEEVSADTFTSRDSEAIGNITSGSKQTVSGLDMDVETGDYIGCYYTAGNIELDATGGTGLWLIEGKYIPCTSQAFTYTDTQTMSLYGIGATAAVAAAGGAGAAAELLLAGEL